MKKGVSKQKNNCKLRKTLGLLSTGAIALSLFMGYNRLTGNVISVARNSTTLSLGGIILFLLGLAGILIIAKE